MKMISFRRASTPGGNILVNPLQIVSAVQSGPSENSTLLSMTSRDASNVGSKSTYIIVNHPFVEVHQMIDAALTAQ